MQNILSFIEFNKGLNFETLASCFLGYLLTLWLLIALWIARDAHKRYGRKLPAFLWFIAVFILNIPAWMLYLIVRPDEWSNSSPIAMNSGMNIPMANFVDKDNRIVMGLQLHINAENLTQAVKDMTVDVNWVSTDPAKQNLESSSDFVSADSKIENPVASSEQSTLIKTLKTKLQNNKAKLTTKVKSVKVKLQEKKKQAAIAKKAEEKKVEEKPEQENSEANKQEEHKPEENKAEENNSAQ